jgi:transcriptional regulator with XRE-family HTH domain
MDFKTKLLTLRKQHHLTQEELAAKLFVTRTAISKWERGIGYPSLDSLIAISQHFHISINELLSSEEIVTLAKEDHNQTISSFSLFGFAILDLITLLVMFLPLFGDKTGEHVVSVSLLNYQESLFLTISYFIIFGIFGLLGVIEILLGILKFTKKLNVLLIFSIGINCISLLLFIASNQPYVSSILFLLMLGKLILLYKKIKTKHM